MTSRRRTTRKTPPLTVSSSTSRRGSPRTGGPAPRTQVPAGNTLTVTPRSTGTPVSGGPAPRSKVTPKPKRLSSGPRGRAFHYEYK